MTEQDFTKVLTFLTLISHFGIVIVIIFYFFFRKNLKWFFIHIGRNGIIYSCLVALSSTLGSLYYSEIAGLPPCDLCWYQRIFMYSLVFMLGYAMLRKDGKKIIPYAILHSLVGGAIALFHVLIQFSQKIAATCSFDVSVSCSDQYFVEYGYISIPVIALTAFLLILIPLCISKKYE